MSSLVMKALTSQTQIWTHYGLKTVTVQNFQITIPNVPFSPLCLSGHKRTQEIRCETYYGLICGHLLKLTKMK